MNTFFVALLAVFAVGSLAQLQTDGTTPRPTTFFTTCDISWARYCLSTYIDSWGFNSSLTGKFPDPNAFNIAASNYINATGVNGLSMAHTWWQALQICLGPNTIPCIFDANTLQQIFQTTATAMDGTLWLITLLEEDFINSQPAYNVIRQNYNCAKQVQTRYDAALTQCQQTYINDVNKDPANTCSYQVYFMTCLQTIYASNCNNRLGGFVCREAGIYFFVMNPHFNDTPPTENFCYPMN